MTSYSIIVDSFVNENFKNVYLLDQGGKLKMEQSLVTDIEVYSILMDWKKEYPVAKLSTILYDHEENEINKESLTFF